MGQQFVSVQLRSFLLLHVSIMKEKSGKTLLVIHNLTQTWERDLNLKAAEFRAGFTRRLFTNVHLADATNPASRH